MRLLCVFDRKCQHNIIKHERERGEGGRRRKRERERESKGGNSRRRHIEEDNRVVRCYLVTVVVIGSVGS